MRSRVSPPNLKVWLQPGSTYVLTIFLTLGALAIAQIQNGHLTGSVADPAGAVIPQAKITVTNVETSLSVTVLTNESGSYIARELPVGKYEITAEATGFKTAVKTELMLSAGAIQRVDFTLVIGSPGEIVEVTGGATPVNTDSTKLSETIGTNQIANLPLNGRNVYDLIQQAPGAVNVTGVVYEKGANTVVNGVRENFNGFLINGISNKGLSGGPANQPILDTVEEFQLLTLNNSAEFGNSAGAITNLVTKSGTNNWHGAGWEYLRNSALDANPFFANDFPNPNDRKRTPLHLNQFGGTFGGPIKKNNLFFFAAYQGDRFITSNPGLVQAESPEFRSATISAFPNSVSSLLYSNFAATREVSGIATLRQYVAAGYSGSGFTSFAGYLCPANTDQTGVLAGKFAKLFGVEQADIDQMNQSPTQGGCPGGSPFGTPMQGPFNRDAPFLLNVLDEGDSQAEGNLFNGNEASLRLDYNFSQNDRIFSQMNWSRATDRFGAGITLRGFTQPYKKITPSFQLSYIHNFSPKVLNELRAGYAGNVDTTDVPFPGVPGILFDDGTDGFGSGNGYPTRSSENIYTYSEVVSVSKKDHDLKIGVDLRRNLENSDLDAGRPDYLFFDSLFFATDAPYQEGVGVDPGIVSARAAQLSTNIRHFRNLEFGAYFQDNWKATRRLTLNLGLRYDLYTRHRELNHLASTFLLGPGQNFIDDLTTGAGRVKSANVPAGAPGCDTPSQVRLAQLAGICGPGGFAKAEQLGAGDHDNLGPRLGLAWDVFGNGKTALRGGFGLSYEGTLYDQLSLTRWNLPYYSLNFALNSLAGDVQDIAYGPQSGGTPRFIGPPDPLNYQGVGAAAVGNINAWNPRNPNLGGLTAIVLPGSAFRDPYVYNWYLGVQREVLPKLTFELNYVGTAGRDLFRAENVNRIPGGRLPEGTCVIDNFGRKLCSQVDSSIGSTGKPLNKFGRLNPNFDQLKVWQNVSNSIYNALQFSVRKQMNHSLQFRAHYTWSHSIDDGSSWKPGTTANGLAAGDGFTTDQTLPGLDRGNSIFDVRNRLTFNYVWELPFARRSSGMVKTILKGWQLNGIWSFQSGAHWSPFDPRPAHITALMPGACAANAQGFISDPRNCLNTGGNYNLDGGSNVGDRPNAIASNVNATHNQWANGFNLPANFFTTPCLGCAGNLGRNTFVGPAFWAADISVFRNSHIREKTELQFRAEAFNILNHTNFQLPDNLINDFTFGQASGTFNPRNLQFGLKLSF